MIACFISGTDTGVGKTWLTTGLMTALKNKGLVVAGMKPVASGGTVCGTAILNADALLIQKHCSKPVSYESINPYSFRAAVAPNIAARQSGVELDVAKIHTAFKSLQDLSEAVIVEGIGGWRVPLADGIQTFDLVRQLRLPVIMVVGLRLGCINHAILTAESMLADGVELLGWVANHLSPDLSAVDETIDSISSSVTAPLLGQMPHLPAHDANEIASCLDVGAIFRQFRLDLS
ncbi:MAG: dethiobiotin synthase [Gammaproteobacteria bacterium]|nr:dethiobiotin synthase [Gammaproteobacteria bacterium]